MAEIVKRQSNYARPANPTSVIESEVFDAGRKARGMLESAQREADGIVQKARAESANIRQQAKEEGFEKGFSEGLEKFQESILEINEKYAALAESAESELLGLCMGVAHKILKQEMKTNPEAIVAIVREAIAPMSRKKTITIRVNPQDRTILQSHRADLMDTLMGSGQIQIVADSDIGQGGCLVETEHGIVDARLETEMNILSRLITGRDFESTEQSESFVVSPVAEDVVDEVPREFAEQSVENSGAYDENDEYPSESVSHEQIQEEPVIETAAAEESQEAVVDSQPQDVAQPQEASVEDAEYSNLMSSIDAYLKSCDEDENT